MASLPQSQVWCGGGVDADMARDLATQQNVSHEIHRQQFCQAQDDLLGNRCDVGMFAVAVTPARQAVMDFANRHMFSDVLCSGQPQQCQCPVLVGR